MALRNTVRRSSCTLPPRSNASLCRGLAVCPIDDALPPLKNAAFMWPLPTTGRFRKRRSSRADHQLERQFGAPAPGRAGAAGARRQSRRAVSAGDQGQERRISGGGGRCRPHRVSGPFWGLLSAGCGKMSCRSTDVNCRPERGPLVSQEPGTRGCRRGGPVEGTDHHETVTRFARHCHTSVGTFSNRWAL